MTATAPASVANVATRIPSLDGIRGLAAVAVVIFHVSGRIGPDAFGRPLGLDLDEWVQPLGNYGVCVFFLLSGLLLYRPFAIAHLGDIDRPRLGSYAIRRLVRIFPAYWMALAAAFILAPHLTGVRRPSTAWGYVGHATLLQNFAPTGFAEGLGVAWTLCVEISFYLMLPLIAWGMTRLPGGSDRDPGARVRAQVAGLVLLASTAWAYRLVFVQSTRGSGIPSHLWLPNYLDWFALGMALAVAHSWRSVGGSLPRPLRVLVQHPGLSWLFALQLYWIGVQVDIEPGLTVRPEFSHLLARFATNGGSAFLLLVPLALARERTPFMRSLDHRAIASVGIVSYGLYLWHRPLLHLLVDNGVERSFVPLFAATMFVSLAIATMSYFVVERPAMRWRRRERRTHERPPRAALTST